MVYLGEEDPTLERIWGRFRLEHGLAAGGVVFSAGVGLTLFANFDSVSDPAVGLLGLTLVALGVQTVFAAFVFSILGLAEHAVLRRRER